MSRKFKDRHVISTREASLRGQLLSPFTLYLFLLQPRHHIDISQFGPRNRVAQSLILLFFAYVLILDDRVLVQVLVVVVGSIAAVTFV